MINQEFNPTSEMRTREDYALYEALLAPLNQAHPQRQGMHEEEYFRALDDDLVIKTIVEIDGREVAVPQLAPVTAYEWLNTDFYRQQFPDEFATGRLMHFMSIPGIEPGEEVVRGIKELADAGGVLVFDMPSSDEEYETRVLATLKSAGVVVSEERLLGTQTYFAGEVNLKRRHEEKALPVGLMESYEAYYGQINMETMSETNDGAYLLKTIEHDQAIKLKELYDNAYQVLNNHPCKQGLTPDEFYAMLTTDTEVGKLVYVRNSEIETLCLLTNKLKDLSWVNEIFYKHTFDHKYNNGQVIWFPGIATDPEKQGERNTSHLINLMADLAEKGDNGFVGVFDFCDINTGFLDKVFEEMINSAPQTAIELEPIATQRYFAFQLHSA
jgi:hypothetical protein